MGRANLNDVINMSRYPLKEFCPVELYMSRLVVGKMHLTLLYKENFYCFKDIKNFKLFRKYPHVFERVTLPHKLPITSNPQSDHDANKHGNMLAYLENYLSHVINKVLNHLNQMRIKYPNISHKETTLKFLSISLKAGNPNKSKHEREKYAIKMKQFISHCVMPQKLLKKANKRETRLNSETEKHHWTPADEEHFLKLAEEFEDLNGEMERTDKRKYFLRYIR